MDYQIVHIRENNLDQLQVDWKSILKSGSPIIALSTYMRGHYRVIYGVSEDNNFHCWSEDAFSSPVGSTDFIANDKLAKEFDFHKEASFQALSFLSGLDARFNYLYFVRTKQ